MVNIANDGYPLIAFEWSFFAVATLFVMARLYVQLRFRHRPWRELFVLAAWSLYLATTVCDSLANGWDYYNASVSWDPDDITDAEVAPALKAYFVEIVTYKPCLYMCKAALLCLYGDFVTRKTKPRLWWAIFFTWVTVIIGTAFQILGNFLSCLPLRLNWTNSIGCPHTYHWYLWFYIITYGLHVGSDLLVFVIPFIILRGLENLTKSQKRRAGGLFALGFLNLSSAILMAVYVLIPSSVTPISFWHAMSFINPFQLGSAILIICLPYCVRLYIGVKTGDITTGVGGSPRESKFSTATTTDLESCRSPSSAEGVFERDHQRPVSAV